MSVGGRVCVGGVCVCGSVWDVFVSRRSFCCMYSICVGVCGECGSVWECVGSVGVCRSVWECVGSVGVCGSVWEGVRIKGVCRRWWVGVHFSSMDVSLLFFQTFSYYTDSCLQWNVCV